MGTASAWTAERRARQANAIRRWKPWEKSTGPRTKDGKANSSRNADKGVAAFHERILHVRLNCQAVRAAELDEVCRLLFEMRG